MDEETQHEEILYEDAIKSLRYGFYVAATLFVAGVVWSLVKRQSPGNTVLPFREIPSQILDGNPTALIDLSILALMLTPVVTVILIAWNFYRLSERRYAVFSLIVLATLVISIARSAL